MIARASFGCVSNQWPTASATAACTTGCTSELTSLSLVCEENFGSGTFTDSTAVMPSRMSSPTSDRQSFLPMPSAYFVTTRVSAWRKPARCEPPSRCGMLLVKHSIVSWKLSFQVSANSTRMPSWSSAVVRLIGGLQHRRLAAVEPLHERDQAAFVAHHRLDRRRVALVAQHDGQAGVQEGQFAQPAFQRGVVEFGLGEGAVARLERDLGAVHLVGRADHVSGSTVSPWRKRMTCSVPWRQMRTSISRTAR